jgi:hypothetical protein
MQIIVSDKVFTHIYQFYQELTPFDKNKKRALITLQSKGTKARGTTLNLYRPHGLYLTEYAGLKP